MPSVYYRSKVQGFLERYIYSIWILKFLAWSQDGSSATYLYFIFFYTGTGIGTGTYIDAHPYSFKLCSKNYAGNNTLKLIDSYKFLLNPQLYLKQQIRVSSCSFVDYKNYKIIAAPDCVMTRCLLSWGRRTTLITANDTT